MELVLICNNFGYGEENTIFYNRTIYWERMTLTCLVLESMVKASTILQLV